MEDRRPLRQQREGHLRDAAHLVRHVRGSERHPPPPRHERLRRRLAHQHVAHDGVPRPHPRVRAFRPRDRLHAHVAQDRGELRTHPGVQLLPDQRRPAAAGEGTEDLHPRHARGGPRRRPARRGPDDLLRRRTPPECGRLRADGECLAWCDPGTLPRHQQLRQRHDPRCGERDGGGDGEPAHRHRRLQQVNRPRRPGDGGELRGERRDARDADHPHQQPGRDALLSGRPPRLELHAHRERHEGGRRRADGREPHVYPLYPWGGRSRSGKPRSRIRTEQVPSCLRPERADEPAPQGLVRAGGPLRRQQREERGEGQLHARRLLVRDRSRGQRAARLGMGVARRVHGRSGRDRRADAPHGQVVPEEGDEPAHLEQQRVARPPQRRAGGRGQHRILADVV